MDTIYYVDNHGNRFGKTASQAIVKACSFTGG
jgi:hypothetical protein